uniref:Uncharacterized protein n=1 Tax=Anguilla anguilla TaxID=7936 RepID=A0A0E9R469_ANGAN
MFLPLLLTRLIHICWIARPLTFCRNYQRRCLSPVPGSVADRALFPNG